MDVMLLDLDCACSKFQSYLWTYCGVSYCGLAIYIKKYLMQKKNYGNETQIFDHAKNVMFKESSKGNQKSFKILHSTTNLKFQHKPRYHLSKILI